VDELGGEGHVFVLGEYAGREGDEAEVSDPFGGDLDVYRDTCVELEALLQTPWSALSKSSRVEVSASTRLLAVIGDPVTHSLSPSMHNAAIRLGLDAVYVALRTPARSWPPCSPRSPASAGRGT